VSPDPIQTLNAQARVRQLADLTRRLTERLSFELKAFQERRPQDVLPGLQETQDLAGLYRRESAQLKAAPAVLAAAPVGERQALARLTQAFEAVLVQHASAVEAARTISEGLVRTIAQEAAAQRGSPAGYGASGQAAAADGRAFALNRTA